MHFLFFLIIGVAYSAFLYILVIPLIYFYNYGGGASSAGITNLLIHKFIVEWGALVFVLLTSLSCVYTNLKQQDLRRAKSHLLTAFIVTVLYLLCVSMVTASLSPFR